MKGHRYFFIAIGLLFVVVTTGAVVATLYFASWRRGAELVRQADRVLRKRDFKHATDLLDLALREHLPNSAVVTAFSMRGAALNQEKRFDLAIRDLDEALRRGNAASPVYFERGFAFQSMNRMDDAISAYTAAIKADPNSAWSYLNRGTILMSRQEWSKAIADFTEAIRGEPRLVPAFLNRAGCFQQLRDYDAALRDYDSILMLEPENSKAHAERGACLLGRGDLNSVLDSARQLLLPPAFDTNAFWSGQRASTTASLPTPSPLPELDGRANWLRKSELYHEAVRAEAMGNYEGALDYYSRMLRMNDSPRANCSAYMNRGNIYLKLHDNDKALVEYNAAIREEPGNAEAYVNRGQLLGELGMQEQAMADFAVALHLNPGRAEAYYNRALEYLKRREVDAAITDLNRAVEFRPDLCESYVKRAEAFSLKGDRVAEVRDLETASTTRCRKMVLNSLAWERATAAAIELRDGVSAIELATDACAETQWKTSACLDTLAAAYAEAGDFGSAIEFERRALAMETSGYEHAIFERHFSLFLNHLPCREYFKN